jgi:hypothetical protein
VTVTATVTVTEGNEEICTAGEASVKQQLAKAA